MGYAYIPASIYIFYHFTIKPSFIFPSQFPYCYVRFPLSFFPYQSILFYPFFLPIFIISHCPHESFPIHPSPINPSPSIPSPSILPPQGNKYHALPWKKYVSIKVDAANLIDSNVKSALQNLHIYDGLAAMYCGEKTVVETTMAKGLAEATKDVKLPVA